MEFLTGDNRGTAESPSKTVIHWISDRPTLEVICEERTPPKTNVVTHVEFRHSLYESNNADMPLFGSGSGGAAGTTGASVRSEDETSRGARLKEDAGKGTTSGASPRNIDNTSRESFPQRSPPDNTRKRDQYALLKVARISSSQEAARHKRLYDRRAGVVELCPGDKVLVCLDSYKGAGQKLINRWSSTLHTVVGRIADDVPAYVIEDDNGKQQVLHRA